MKYLRLTILFILATTSLFAQQNLNDKLPVDPDVKIGKLSNGPYLLYQAK